MAISAVKMALETVQEINLDEDEAFAKEEQQLQTILDGLMPIERPAYRQIEAKLKRIQERREILQITRQVGGLPILDTNVLTWTKRQKMPYRLLCSGHRPTLSVPAFAYVPVNAQRMNLSASWGSPDYFSGLPEVVALAFHRALLPLARHTGRPFTPDRIKLLYEYPGAVPPAIKRMIETETRFPKEQLAFICEVDRWAVTSERVSLRERRRMLDPILVGHKNGTLFKIAAFDPTPVEQYLLDEFTH